MAEQPETIKPEIEKPELPPVDKATDKPVIDPAKSDAPPVSSDVDIDLDEPIAQVPTDKVKFKKDQFKEFDDDLAWEDDEEIELDPKAGSLVQKLLERGKGYKAKTNEYKTIAEANKTVNEDELIKTYTKIHDSSDEEVLLQKEYSKFKRTGKSDDEALRLAQEEVDELKNESEKLFTKAAKDRRLELQSVIYDRAQQIQSDIQKTAKALSLSNAPNPDLLKNANEHLSKLDSFLGLKFGGKNETSRKDFVKPVAEAIKDGSLLKKLQSDPQLLAEIGMYVQYKDKFTKAVENRKATRATEKDKLAKAPHSDGKPPLVTDMPPNEGSGLKDAANFR